MKTESGKSISLPQTENSINDLPGLDSNVEYIKIIKENKKAVRLNIDKLKKVNEQLPDHFIQLCLCLS